MSSTARLELDSLIKREGQKCKEQNESKAIRAYTDCYTFLQRLLNCKDYRPLIGKAFGEANLRFWDEEPHLRLKLLRDEKPIAIDINDDSFMRLRLDAPGKSYETCQIDSTCLYSDVHIGQRKLLISEVLFMTLHGSKSSVVVYIGAAGGQHIPALCELFPSHKFLLYDPSPFSKQLMDYMRNHKSRVTVYNELFPPAPRTRSRTELEAVTSGDNGFLLISDIRRKEESAEAPTNLDVDADMELQADICSQMNPKAAHLKCRLPYLDPEANPPEPDIQVTIPKGDIYFQPWCGHKSTETRLIIEPPYISENTVTLSARWYESALYYHNVNTRYARFYVSSLTPLDPFLGTIYDRCFDCTFERYTLWLYLTSVASAPPEYRNYVAIYEMFKRILGREDERLLR